MNSTPKSGLSGFHHEAAAGKPLADKRVEHLPASGGLSFCFGLR